MNNTLRPASARDWNSKTQLYSMSRQGYLTKVLKRGARHCSSNMQGPSLMCTWIFEGTQHTGQGHVPVQPYKTATQYRLATGSEPRLWVLE